ncbi:hypothetical protein M407DRAFT_123610 [Tulasnella calospora MUT 4182]|uniref:Uncharacterized protein n=1 Tax=Tulasnella calospora MUT 4182 TaxID=1051891 RepID=A0A0C3QBM2_9AGAM|nr:hypothetical protein M407DRAFT_123610 [Tulasnella calospora MUT 4182]
MSRALDTLPSSSVSRRPSASSQSKLTLHQLLRAESAPATDTSKPSISFNKVFYFFFSSPAATVTQVSANPSPRHHRRQLSNSYVIFASTAGDLIRRASRIYNNGG